MDRALASSLQGITGITAFEDVTAERFDDLDLSALLMYLVNTVGVDALPYLADQFDVLGLKGYGLASTEAERRQVIARAIELAKYRGTPYGIKFALEQIGYPNSAVIERLGFLYNGVFDHSAVIDYGGGQWASFAVWVNNGLSETPADIDLIRKMVDIYKNVRSSLVQIVFVAPLYDEEGVLIPGAYVLTIDGDEYEISVAVPTEFAPEEVIEVTVGGATYSIPVITLEY